MRKEQSSSPWSIVSVVYHPYMVSYLWPSSDAPKYTKGFATVSLFIGFGILLTASLPAIFTRLSRHITKAEREMHGNEYDVSV